jgi:hypothetical protein
MTRQELLARLLDERYGPLATVEPERPPTPEQIEARRQVLLGDGEPAPQRWRLAA